MKYICEVCGTSFSLTHRFQVFRDADKVRYFCSEACRKQAVSNIPIAVCEICKKSFPFEFAYQQINRDGKIYKVCSFECRRVIEEMLAPSVVQATKMCIAAQKGGTGKTTTAFHLAYGFARKGYPTLLIDADPQGSLTSLFKAMGEPGLIDILSGKSLLEVAKQINDKLTFIPCGNEQEVGSKYDVEQLRNHLGALTDFRIVIFDVSPAMTSLTEAVLIFCGTCLIPVSCDYLSVLGVKQLSSSLNNIRSRIGKVINLLGVIPTFYDHRTRASRTVMGLLESYFPGKILPPIRVSADIKETGGVCKPVFEYLPKSRGASDYNVLVDAVEERLGISP